MNRDDELATEVAWVVVYLSALSDVAISKLLKSDLLQVLVERLEMSNSLQLLIPVRYNDNLFIDSSVGNSVMLIYWKISL